MPSSSRNTPCSSDTSLSQQLLRVMRNHQFLVRCDHEHGDAAIGGTDAGPAACVGFGVELNTEPRGIATDPFAHCSAVFADTRSENNCIESAQCRRKRPELASDAVDEEIDRIARG